MPKNLILILETIIRFLKEHVYDLAGLFTI